MPFEPHRALLGISTSDERRLAGIIQAAGYGFDIVPQHLKCPQHLIAVCILRYPFAFLQIFVRNLADNGLTCVRVLHREIHGISISQRLASLRSCQWHRWSKIDSETASQ
jgi:hypothetical protein